MRWRIRQPAGSRRSGGAARSCSRRGR
jgi:hypothetical protein